jgi:hypothetical protein
MEKKRRTGSGFTGLEDEQDLGGEWFAVRMDQIKRKKGKGERIERSIAPALQISTTSLLKSCSSFNPVNLDPVCSSIRIRV